jgi:hypothetical protein
MGSCTYGLPILKVFLKYGLQSLTIFGNLWDFYLNARNLCGGSLSAAHLRHAPSLDFIFVYSEFGSYAKFRKYPVGGSNTAASRQDSQGLTAPDCHCL